MRGASPGASDHPEVFSVRSGSRWGGDGGVLTCPVGRGAEALAQLHLLLQEGGPLSIPGDGPAPGQAVLLHRREASLAGRRFGC